MATATEPTTRGRRAAGGLALTVSRESLEAALARALLAVPSKSNLPVLTMVKLETGVLPGGASDAMLYSTDLDVAVRTRLTADVSGHGAVCVAAKTLADIVKQLPPAPIAIAWPGRGRVTVRAGRAKFELAALVADEFPRLGDVDFTGEQTVPADVLARMIPRVAFAVSTEERRPILHGVLIEADEAELTLVATNGHRLVRISRPMPEGAEIAGVVRAANDSATAGMIVPGRALRHVPKLFDPADSLELALGAEGRWLGIASATTQYRVRLIEGPYPNYRAVIPGRHSREFAADRHAFSATLARLEAIASTLTNLVGMQLEEGKLARLVAARADMGEGVDFLPGTYTGEPLRIGLNAEYLRELLRAVGGDTVVLRMTTHEGAIAITSPDADPAGVTILAVLMPLRLIDEGALPFDGGSKERR